MIYGVPECQSKVGAERKENDHKFINKLFGETLRVDLNDLNIDKIIRMGAINEQATRPRPLLIGFDSESDMYKVLKSTYRLKGQEEYKGVTLEHDMTKAQRRTQKELSEEAKKREESDQSGNFIYRVRGRLGRRRVVKIPKIRN